MPISSSGSDSFGSAPTIGLDLGGTKCAVCHLVDDRAVEMLRVPTRGFAETFSQLEEAIASLMAGREPPVFGVSCGGPLDAATGVIISPPNLAADWHGVAIVERLTRRFGGRAVLMNDANACALAEWKFGAGRGCEHMVFLTSGTGMGAGLILNGQLYEGATGDAGEIGHVRLRADGPLGYGKHGSVEGFTSGGGIARLALARLSAAGGTLPEWFASPDQQTTKQLAEAAQRGDTAALAIFDEAGELLGEALAILVDLFNPERIVLGGFYPLCRPLLEPSLRVSLAHEALTAPAGRCEILPSTLGATIGSYGAIAAALHARATGKFSGAPSAPANPSVNAIVTAGAAATAPRVLATPVAAPLDDLLRRLPELVPLRSSLERAYDALHTCLARGGKLLLCGNGGSASDAEHWAGELLKGFRRARPLSAAQQEKLSPEIARHLQGALAAIPLTGFPALATAYANDVNAEMIFAQLTWALGQPGDVWIGLSTSGNARNVCVAAEVARARGLITLCLTGQHGGRLAPLCDFALRVPATETFRVQESHLPLYHCLSLMLEETFFPA